MDNSKDQGSKATTTDIADGENPNNNNNIDSSILTVVGGEGESMTTGTGNGTGNGNGDGNRNPSSVSRTPFTNLSQVDADLALARTLQDQERAYMMLRMNGNASEYGRWEAGSYVHEDDDDFDNPSEEDYDGSDGDDDEDAFGVHAHLDLGSEVEDSGNRRVVALDPASFPSDEAYARALQDAEDQEMAARFLALSGINEMVTEVDDDDIEDDGGNSQDTWDDVDPDELSYEELLALGEVVGTESRGLSADSIASLPSTIYKTEISQNGSSDTCVICRLDYEDGDNLTFLSCKHSYHSECITNWLQINKVCPVCSAEVSTSGTAS